LFVLLDSVFVVLAPALTALLSTAGSAAKDKAGDMAIKLANVVASAVRVKGKRVLILFGRKIVCAKLGILLLMRFSIKLVMKLCQSNMHAIGKNVF
jgi:hypothetical protein